jgi:pimeloyl-ACP methyl ester carboxylesterase
VDTLVVDGQRLEIERLDEGDAGAPTLVFLHEGLGSVSAWRDFPAALARATGARAFVYSRAGYGQSDPIVRPRPIDFMHREAQRLPAIIAAAGLADRDLVLVGHSDGGSIALIAAATDVLGPQLRALVLEAPHVFVEDSALVAIAEVRQRYVAGDLRAGLSRHHADVDGAFYGWNDVWLDPAFRSWNLEPLLPHVRVPALVVQGVDDRFGTLAQVDAICSQLGAPCERLILAACGHSPHRDQPARTLAALSDFIRRHSAPVEPRDFRRNSSI